MKIIRLSWAFLALMTQALLSQTTTIWSVDFESATAGDTSGNNQTLAGENIQTANAMSGVVVNLDEVGNETLRSEFTNGVGNVFLLSDGGNAFAAIRATGPINDFGTVLASDTYTFSFDLFIPGTEELAIPVGDINPRLELQGTDGNGPTLAFENVSQPGQHRVVYTGFVDEIINQGSPTQANVVQPFIGFNQSAQTDNTSQTPDFVYIDNILFEIESGAAEEPIIKDFSLSLNGVTTNEREAFLFTTGDDSQEGVYTITGREFFYDVDGVTSLTLNSDAPGHIPVDITVNGPTSGVITPVIPSTAGIYTYTLEASDDLDTIMSEPIVISVDQPFVFNTFEPFGGGSRLSQIGEFRFSLEIDGDYVTDGPEPAISGTFSLPDLPVVSFDDATFGFIGDDLDENDPGQFSNGFSANPASYNLQDILDTIDPSGVTVYPAELTLSLTATNQIGDTTQEIVITIDDSNIFAELAPANFANARIPNTYVDLFTAAEFVPAPITIDDPSVTFTEAIAGTFTLGATEATIGSGFKMQNVSLSTWIEIPENPTGNVIIDFGGLGTQGTTLGYDNGQLVARLQENASVFSTLATPISAGWHHIVLLIDIEGVTAQLTLHVDGQAAVVGTESSDIITNWHGGFANAVIFGTQANGYAGQNVDFLPSPDGLNGSFGQFRAYAGILEESQIQALAAEFRVPSAARPQIVSSEIDGGAFQVTATGLSSGTTYFLLRSPDLSSGFMTVVDTQVAGTMPLGFSDATPPSGRAFYVVSDTDPTAAP